MAVNPRLNRLRQDYKKLQDLAARSPFVHIETTEGDPPNKYVLHLTCKGVKELKNGQPVYSESHRVTIHLHDEYPRTRPEFKLLTPIYHPNFSSNGAICIGDIGDHGYAPTMILSDLVVRIVEMIRYENFNPLSAYNWAAGQWANQNSHLLPLDTRQIVGEELLEINILDEIQLVDAGNTSSDLLNEIVIL